MSKNEKELLVPRLRFPEFQAEGEWLTPTLGEVSEPVNERVGNRKLMPISISAGIGFVPQSEKFGRDISGNQYKLYTVVRDGDFVYNKGNSLKFPQGCVYDLQGWGKVAAPHVFICFRLKEGYENGFYRQCFENNAHGIQLRKHITSGARSNGLLNISKEAFYGVKIPTPKVAEQKKIAECLSSLDSLLTAEAQKLDALKKYKTGLMQQLFPREGENIPLLRFLEFRAAGQWAEIQLGNVVNIRSGYSPSYYCLKKDGIYPFVKVEDLNNCAKYQTEAREYSDDIKSLIPCNSIIFPKRGAAIALNKIRLSAGELLIDTNLMALIPSEKCDPNFLYYYLSHVGLSQLADNSTIPQINNKHIIPFKMLLPAIDEQQKIANCISALDENISSQYQVIEVLNTHKRGLMQQLFPVFEEVLR